MGSKVNPNGLRFGINKQWNSRWVAKNNLQAAQWIVEEDKIRTSLINNYKNAKIDHIEIERMQGVITIFVYCSQPGIILGNENSELSKVILMINKIVGRNVKVNINVIGIENPDLSARIIAREIADAIENRVSFRNAQKAAIRKVLRAGAKGVKTHVSGRLGGVEMAREEGYSEGVVTLSTLRADIDYALEEANTTYGIIGVKVWINRGEIFKKDLNKKTNNLNSKKTSNFKSKEKTFNSSKKPSQAKTNSNAKKEG